VTPIAASKPFRSDLRFTLIVIYFLMALLTVSSCLRARVRFILGRSWSGVNIEAIKQVQFQPYAVFRIRQRLGLYNRLFKESVRACWVSGVPIAGYALRAHVFASALLAIHLGASRLGRLVAPADVGCTVLVVPDHAQVPLGREALCDLVLKKGLKHRHSYH